MYGGILWSKGRNGAMYPSYGPVVGGYNREPWEVCSQVSVYSLRQTSYVDPGGVAVTHVDRPKDRRIHGLSG